jgi:hypothetical protein
MSAVVAVAAPYWAGEAEIVRTHFSRPRTLAQDLFWLRAQAYKETRPFLELPKNLQEEFLRTGAVANPPEGAKAGQRVAQEMKHFRLLADLLFDLSGVSVSPADLTQLSEDRKLQELRAAYRAQGGALERAAVDFTEGGGGAMFQVLSQLDGGELERRIAAIFKTIAEDEKAHGPLEIYAIARHASSAADWLKAQAIVRDISQQRVLMRNEMFGYPLPPTRIQEITEGKIASWPMPIPL